MQLLLFERLVHAQHGELHDISGRPLDRGVECDALAEGTCVEIAAFELRKHPAAAKQRRNKAVTLCLFHNIVHIGFHAGVVVQITLDIPFGLRAGNADIL